MTQAEQVVACLAGHKISASVLSSIEGPRVTSHTLALDPKIRVRRVQLLEADLGVALGSPMVRVVIDDRVRIEVPRESWQPVSWQPGQGMAVVLGRDQSNRACWLNLAEAPHLLIAGSTGSGKSVTMKSILYSLASQQSPDTLALAYIDLKRVELACLGELPHCFAGAVDPEAAVELLQGLNREMDRRYRDGGTCLPRVVLAVDEMADLLLGTPQAEPLLVRLAQMGRAAGIHLILATQRPDSRVVPGILKANIPCRIALALPSHVDSRVVLDVSGAEKLLGRGDMLLRVPGMPLRRAQGSVAGPEIAGAASEWQKTAFRLPAEPLAVRYTTAQEALDIFRRGDPSEIATIKTRQKWNN